MKSIGILSLLFLIFQQTVDIEKIDSKLFDKINVIRVENKCIILKRDENLDKAAINQAEYIASKEVLDHVQKGNPQTKELLQRVKFFCKNEFTQVAENLLFTTIPKTTIDYEVFAEKMKSLWIKSPSHLKTLRTPSIITRVLDLP